MTRRPSYSSPGGRPPRAPPGEESAAGAAVGARDGSQPAVTGLVMAGSLDVRTRKMN